MVPEEAEVLRALRLLVVGVEGREPTAADRHAATKAARPLGGDRLPGGWEDGVPLRLLARWMNGRGITTSRGNAWVPQVINRTLRGPHLAGLRVQGHRGKAKPVKGTWPAIFTVEERDELLRRLGRNPVPPITTPRHLLGGMLLCGRMIEDGVCGSRLTAKTSRHWGRRYECQTCQRNTITAEGLAGC
jgi:hypothetical protein